jgi:two-component system response regulator ResD
VPARILIIDDEEHIRTSLTCFFEDFEEFQIRSAHSAEEALDVLRAEPADLCVVDLRLPALNGADFIRIARHEGLCEHHVLHTGSTDFRQFIDINELGMTDEDIFLKPCDSMAMLLRIHTVLGLR